MRYRECLVGTCRLPCALLGFSVGEISKAAATGEQCCLAGAARSYNGQVRAGKDVIRDIYVRVAIVGVALHNAEPVHPEISLAKGLDQIHGLNYHPRKRKIGEEVEETRSLGVSHVLAVEKKRPGSGPPVTKCNVSGAAVPGGDAAFFRVNDPLWTDRWFCLWQTTSCMAVVAGSHPFFDSFLDRQIGGVGS